MNTPLSNTVDLVVFGDEIESILTAVSAARMGLSVALVRHSTGLLGGLSTRGGLSYMDITLAFKPPLFREFLDLAGVTRIALEPQRANRVLASLMAQSRVLLLSGMRPVAWEKTGETHLSGIALEPVTGNPEASVAQPLTVQARHFIDATPDADLSRLAGVPFIKGLGGLLPEGPNYLGISPVFEIHGTPKQPLMAFETRLRQDPRMPDWVARALYRRTPKFYQELLNRVALSPDDEDYLDILNPILGIAFHVWREGTPDTYFQAIHKIDGGNISLLGPERMGFNGLVSSMATQTEDPFETLLAYSHGAPVPQELHEVMQSFGEFLRTEGGMAGVSIVPPQELYVRQTLTLLARQNMTAESALRGGVPLDEAIGTFSYWLDFRGISLPNGYFPKPVYNVGLQCTFPLSPVLDNLAFIGRSAGYSPLGQGTGRIIQHNAMLGEALGIAAALACQRDCAMAEVPIALIKGELDLRNGMEIPLVGQQTWYDKDINANPWVEKDNALMAAFREPYTLNAVRIPNS